MSAGAGAGDRLDSLRTSGAPLVGREKERARLDALLDAARDGRSGVVVLRGEAGVGKTALLDCLAAEAAATGMRVLRSRGAEAEAELAFAALEALLRPVLSYVDGLPPRQAAALRGALALSEFTVIDRFAVYVATLAVLAAMSEEGPMLVVVDDAQWLDEASAEALVFGGRRLEAEGIALVFAARDGDPDEFTAPGYEELRVGGLDRDAVGRLLELHVAGRVASRVVDRLAVETAGNPLALIELSALLTPAQLCGAQPLDEPLVAGEAARRAFLRRVEALPARSRDAVVVAATAGGGQLAPVLAALDALGIGSDALSDVEGAGLIHIGEGQLVFEHPVVRSAVYAAADPAQRRAAHRALAAALGGTRSDRRAWHLAAATVGPDEDVAAALEQAAELARRRSGYAAAGRALERAAQLTSPGSRRVKRLIAAADAMLAAGRPDDALELLRVPVEDTTDPRLRAAITETRARLEWYRGRARRAQRFLAEAAAHVEATDSASTVRLLVSAALAALDAGDVSGGLAIARRAHERASDGAPGTGVLSAVTLAAALYGAGDAAQAHGLLAETLPTADMQQLAALHPELILFIAMMAALAGIAVEQARLLADLATDEFRAAGALGLLPFALSVSILLLARDGEGARAHAAAGEAARIAADVGSVHQRHRHLGILAGFEAVQGREAECRAYVEEARALLASSELAEGRFLEGALGLLELGAGRSEQAQIHLDAATTVSPDADDTRRLAQPNLGDLVEAHLRCSGYVPEALMTAVRRAGEGDFEGFAAIAERCFGLVADEQDVDAHFQRALELHGAAWPFARARTQLCYGERLRRAGRRVDARAQLRAALDTFERLGARPWAERAAEELRATGERVTRRDPTASERLTPQELQIALTVARGATNREAGAALFLSPKTIEFHLGRVYRKLGLRSRTELAPAFAAQSAAQT